MDVKTIAIANISDVLSLAGISVGDVTDTDVESFDADTKVGATTFSAGKYVSVEVKVLVPCHNPLQ